MDNPQPATLAPRSSFVTVLAWTFIVIAGFSVLISLLQNAMFALVVPSGEMDDMVNALAHDPAMPAMASFMLRHFRAIIFSFFVISAAMLIVSIALLKRKNWARLAVIWLLALSIVGNLAWPFYQYSMMSNFMPALGGLEQEFGTQIQMVRYIMFGFTLVLMLGFSWLSAWLIKKLASPEIKAEFIAQPV